MLEGQQHMGDSMKQLSILVTLCLLAGCATNAQTSETIGPKPANYQDAVRAHAKAAFFDPYSIRDAAISQPIPVSAVFDGITPIPHSGWMVCLHANGKNRFGAYTGLRLTGFLFQDGVISTTLDDAGVGQLSQVADHCKTARYEPFSI
jgi:hypothetical protein